MSDDLGERRGRVDWAAFDRLMGRAGGEPPRPGDEWDGPPAPLLDAPTKMGENTPT